MMMNNDARFTQALDKIDQANRQDPRTEMVDGTPTPRELIFSQRVYDWVVKLVADPSEELRLAARAHTLGRWRIPRDQYPMTTIGYHQWRGALANLHADEAASILGEIGYPADEIQTVRNFITKANWPADTEACALEDADCLVFLETKMPNYVDTWEESKAIHILQRTFKKMTPESRALVNELELSDSVRELVNKAINQIV